MANKNKDIWQEVLANGNVMVVDTTHNIIRIINSRGNRVKYEFVEDPGITIEDITSIRNSHSRLRG